MIIAGSNCYGWTLLVFSAVTVVSGFVGKAPKVTFRCFVPDEFVFGALDYLFAVGVWGFRILGLGRVLGMNSHGFILTLAGFVNDTGV